MKEFDSWIDQETFEADRNLFLNKPSVYKTWNYQFKSPKDLKNLNILIPLIPPISNSENNQDYYEFSRCYLGPVAITPELKVKISLFLEEIVTNKNGEEKLQNLFIFFLQSQINEYRDAALNKSSPLSVDYETVKKELEVINLESSPAFQAAKKLHSIKPELFKDKNYLGSLWTTWKLFYENIPDTKCFDIFKEVKTAVYEEFLEKIKNQSLKTNQNPSNSVKPKNGIVLSGGDAGEKTNKPYRGYALSLGSIIAVGFLAKKYHWYTKLQEFLDQYKNK